MKVRYDKRADAAYIQFSSKKPDGAVEAAGGIIVHTTAKEEIVGIEILTASKRLPVRNLFKFEASASVR